MFEYFTGKKNINGVGSRSTADEIGLKYKDEIKDKVVIITGCNTGIGKQTVKALVVNGAKVVMACRNLDKCNEAIKDIRLGLDGSTTGSSSTTSSSDNQNSSSDTRPAAATTTKFGTMIPLQCDLSSFDSIRTFVDEFHQLNLPLNILINNAGVMACDFKKTKDDHEMQFGTNHLGHFLLTELLLGDLKKSTPGSRIVTVASTAHLSAYKEGIRFDRLGDEKGYSKFGAYGQSKLANILHVRELNERFEAEKVDITANALHPGVIATPLWRHLSIIGPVLKVLGAPFMKNEQQGAATTMYLACSTASDAKKGGGYFLDCHNADKEASAHSKDQKLWQKLREISMELTGTGPKK